MKRGDFQSVGLLGKLAMLFFAFFFFSIIGLAVTMLFGNGTDMGIMKINQLILSVFSLLLPPIVCGYLWYSKPSGAYHLNKTVGGQVVMLTMLLFFMVSPFINLLYYINSQMVLPDFLSGLEQLFMELEDKAAEFTEQMLDVTTIGGLLLNLLVIAVMPAIGEELFFRGALLNIFSEKIKNNHTVVWLVAIIFSLIHFQMYGFLPRMILGALLGYLLIWSQSLWLPIVAHFTNNALAVIVSYGGKYSTQVEAFEELGKPETVWFGVASLIFSLIIVRVIYKKLHQPIPTH